MKCVGNPLCFHYIVFYLPLNYHNMTEKIQWKKYDEKIQWKKTTGKNNEKNKMKKNIMSIYKCR